MEKISVLKSTPFVSQDYSTKDSNLISQKQFDKTFQKTIETYKEKQL